MELDFALVRFEDGSAATETFVAARDRSGAAASWPRDRSGAAASWAQHVGLVEHHRNGHLVLRGTFAGHYVDVDEALHVSERGAGEGSAGGGLVGILGGPPGIAVGIVLGGLLGSQLGTPSETDSEPQPLADQLRAAVPRAGSAIVMIAEPSDVDDMVAAIGDSGGELIRHTLTADEVAAVQASLRATPAASRGPSQRGEVAVEASEPRREGA
jgi:uncharacterized membrane protein